MQFLRRIYRLRVLGLALGFLCVAGVFSERGWVALMEFSLLPSVVVIAMLSMDKVAWGTALLARASAAMAVGCAIAAVLTGASFRPSTSMPALPVADTQLQP
jgi:hypothetical protein